MPNASVRAAATGLPKKTEGERFALFLDAVLSPVPTAEIIDFAYNRDMRNARLPAWRLADAESTLLRAQLDLLRAEGRLKAAQARMAGGGPIYSGLMEAEVLAAMRRAEAAQVVVPAPDQAAIAWKRSALRGGRLPITEEQANAAIAADEAFLAAHPITRAKARSIASP